MITWLNPGTLHLVGSNEYWWLHALPTTQLATGSTRRLGTAGTCALRRNEVTLGLFADPTRQSALRWRSDAAHVARFLADAAA